MGYIKKFVEFICERQQEDLYDAQKIVLTLKDGFEQKKKWDAFKKSEFNDIAVLKKGKYGLRLDLRIDGVEEYKANNHPPCVYFRNGEGEMDFLPMIICNKPYIPYPFVQNISDEELLWIYRFVSRNKKLLLKYANDKISSLDLFNRINENAEVSYVNEGSEKIRKQDSGLSRYVWIGPYENTNHYLRLKIQTPKSSTISEEWASLSIPDLEIKKERGEYDLIGKEELAVKRFAIINKEALDDFAKDMIDFDELIQTIIKVDKKGKPILKGKDNIEYTNEKDGNLSVIEDQNYETMDELLQTVYTDEMLLEMARVDDPRNIPFKNKKSVWIYSDDRSKMTPHFYYYLDGSKKIYLEISISELKIIFSTPRKGVSDNKLLTWSELSKEKDEIREWLQRQNTDYPGFTNYIVLAKTWNQNNRDNQIDISKLNLDIAIKNII